MWSISKEINDGEVKCRQEKESNSTKRNLCEQLESSTERHECKGNRTRSQSTTNLYRSQEESRVNNMYRSNDNRNNINRSNKDSRANQCKSDENKNNMNTCYDESILNTKRFSEDSRHSSNKLNGYKLFEGDQPSVKRSSRLKLREYMDAGERVPEEFPQRSGRPRRPECNTGERQRNRRQRQPTTQKSNISDDYEQNYYDGIVNTHNCQPNRDSQKLQQQNFHQNQEDTPRRQSYLDRVPFVNEYRMKGGCAVSSADTGRVKECSVADRKQGRWQQHAERWHQPDEDQVNELQTDNIMARVEMQRLYSLQCIERHQRALVLEIQQLLKNEQEQSQLRMVNGKQKVAGSRRQTDIRCLQEQVRELREPEEQEQVREKYKPTPFERQQYRPGQLANSRNAPVRRQPLSSPRRPVASGRPQRCELQYGDQMPSANYSTGTEDSGEEQRQQSMMCPSCSGLDWPEHTAKPKQTESRASESTPRGDSCSSFELDDFRTSVGFTSTSRAKRGMGLNRFATVQSPSRSKFSYDCAPDVIAGNDKIKKSASADDQSRRHNYTAPNESQRADVSPQDTISEYYLSTRKSTSSSSSAPCLQTQMSPLNRDGRDVCPDLN